MIRAPMHEDLRHRHPQHRQQGRENGTHDPAAVDHRRVQADRTGKILTVDEERHRRLEGRCVERVGDADSELGGEDRPQHRLAGHEEGDEYGEGQRDRLHPELQLLLGDAVGQHTSGDREQQHRTQLHEDHRPDECRTARAGVDVRGQREVLHPRADVRERQPDEDDPELPRGECSAGGAGAMAARG